MDHTYVKQQESTAGFQDIQDTRRHELVTSISTTVTPEKMQRRERIISTSTGNTSQQPSEGTELEVIRHTRWSLEEKEFVREFRKGPKHERESDNAFWNRCAAEMNVTCRGNRTGSACKTLAWRMSQIVPTGKEIPSQGGGFDRSFLPDTDFKPVDVSTQNKWTFPSVNRNKTYCGSALDEVAMESDIENKTLSEGVKAVQDTYTVDPTHDNIVAETFKRLSGTLSTFTWASTSEDDHTANGNLQENLRVDDLSEKKVINDVLDMEEEYEVNTCLDNKSSHGDSSKENGRCIPEEHSTKTFMVTHKDTKTSSEMPGVQVFGQTQTSLLDSYIVCDWSTFFKNQPFKMLTTYEASCTDGKSVCPRNIPTLSRLELQSKLVDQKNEVIFFKYFNNDRNATKGNQETSVLHQKLPVTDQSSSLAKMQAHLQRRAHLLPVSKGSLPSTPVYGESSSSESIHQWYSGPSGQKISPKPKEPPDLTNSYCSKELKKVLKTKSYRNHKFNNRVDTQNRFHPYQRPETHYQLSLPNLPEFQEKSG